MSVTDKQIDENFKELMKPKMRVKYIDEVEFCCKKMRVLYSNTKDIKLDGERNRIIVKGKPMTQCPFCKTDMEIDVSVSHYGGE